LPQRFLAVFNPELLISGPYEVALEELHTTNTWYNIQEGTCSFILVGSFRQDRRLKMVNETLAVPSGHYNAESLVATLHDLIIEQGLGEAITFAYHANSDTVRMVIKTSPRASGPPITVTFSDTLHTCLGLEKTLTAGTHTGHVQLPHIDELYVYTSLIESHMVGHKSENLLRVVPVKYGQLNKKFFYEPKKSHYENVSPSGLHTALFTIRDGDGQLVPFAPHTRIIYTLLFRPKYK
jgi:hypothetical protein